MDTGHKIQVLRSNIERVIKGKPAVVEMAVVALLARGHLLIEDVPGVGKTTLAHSLARSLGCSFRRIQFTSDLLPADILGVSIFHQQKRSEEHTSELQSRLHLVCRLLLEKKKTTLLYST